MHVKAKKMAFGGVLLALSVIFMYLGSIIETNTLFLLAAASYFVGFMIRECGVRNGAAFYLAGVLLGMLTAPNKFYVVSYAGMGLYILLIEVVWKRLARLSDVRNRRRVFWAMKAVIFNVIYISAVSLFWEMLFGRTFSAGWFAGVLLAGQAGLLIYDQAYEYVQRELWGKIRGKVL